MWLNMLEIFYNIILSAVGVATGYELDDGEVGVPVEERFFSSPRPPDRLWGPARLLYEGYRAPFPRDKAAHEVDHSSNYCRDQEYVDLYIHSLILLYDVVLN
jgi:hypothetical protein